MRGDRVRGLTRPARRPITGSAIPPRWRAGMRHRACTAVAFFAALAAVAGAAEGEPEQPPKDLGLVERATTRLQQIDVTLFGPKEVLDQIGPDDFEVKVAGVKLQHILVDRVCQEPLEVEVAEAQAPESPPAPAAAPPAQVPATFVFYLDQTHMTQTGRANAIDTARDLVPKLIRNGARGMIISNAKNL